MKKLCFLILISIMYGSIYGQTEKGTILLGSLYYNSGSGEASNLISFNPHIGYFAGNNFALGLNYSFLWKFDEKDFDLVNAVGPYIKIYFGDNARGKYFTQIKPVLAMYNFEFDYMIYGISVNAGYSFFLNKMFTMDYSLKYDKLKNSDSFVSLEVAMNFHLQSNKK